MKKMILLLAMIVFVTYSGSMVSAEQLLKENNIQGGIQVTFVGNGAVDDDTANFLQSADDKGLSSNTGFSSKTQISATSSSKYSTKTPVLNAAPVASIDYITPNPATKGSSVTFRGSGTDDGSIRIYLWKLDGKILSTRARFSTSSIAAGDHTITLTVRDNSWKWSEEVTTTLTVIDSNVAPVASIDSITPNPATKGSSVTFRGSGTDDGSIRIYLWKLDGKILSTRARFSTSSIAAGDHTITLTVRDNSWKWSEEVTTTLTVIDSNVAPVASIDSITPNPATKGSSVT
ncbi:PKD domain-containing protein, partial [Methanolobus sp.]|uniref:PKD domain-containing protein n=1 Tax=Methanolobus sp. TaxID=1874737 RepID=UPI0025EAB222